MGQRLVDSLHTGVLHARHPGCLCRHLVGALLESARISDVTFSDLRGFYYQESPEKILSAEIFRENHDQTTQTKPRRQSRNRVPLLGRTVGISPAVSGWGSPTGKIGR